MHRLWNCRDPQGVSFGNSWYVLHYLYVGQPPCRSMWFCVASFRLGFSTLEFGLYVSEGHNLSRVTCPPPKLGLSLRL